MNNGDFKMFEQLSTEEIALLLHGLRSVHVSDLEVSRKRLVKKLEKALAKRGASLPEAA